LSPEQCAERSRRAIRLKLKRTLRPDGLTVPWTWEQLRVLGKEPDGVVAARTGRSVNGVRVKRTWLGIRTALDRRKG
jgi:hypothetical protein